MKKYDLATKLGIFSISLLATVFAVYTYSPVIKTHADGSATSSVDVNLSVAPRLSIYVDDYDAQRMKSRTDNFVSETAHIYVDTNSSYGYSLMLEDVDENTNLENRSTSSNSRFTSTFSGSKTSETMDPNTWGYSMDSSNYYKIPVFGNPVLLRSVSSAIKNENDAKTDVEFGVKVGSSTMSGYYADMLLASAIVNGQDGTQVYTMQNFKCPSPWPDYDDENWEMPERTWTLKDERDGRTYEVVLLKDGNCWMTQNLDITDYLASTDDTQYAGRFSGNKYLIPDSLNDWSFTYNSGEVYETSTEDYGAYYNYNAASLGGTSGAQNSTNYYGSGMSSCPSAKWNLPSSNDWSKLFSGYSLSLANGISADDLLQVHINLEKSGSYTLENGVNGQGSIGAWWTDTAPSSAGDRDTKRNIVLLDNNGLRLETSDRRNGHSIRCMMKGTSISNNPSEPKDEESSSTERE